MFACFVCVTRLSVFVPLSAFVFACVISVSLCLCLHSVWVALVCLHLRMYLVWCLVFVPFWLALTLFPEEPNAHRFLV